MSKKKPEKKKSPYPENGKVKIRHSYYTFAREFPSKILPLEGKRRKNRKKRILQNVISCFIFVFLLLLSYFTVNLFVDISYTDADKLSGYTQQTAPTPDEGELLPFGGESVKALYMPEEKLGDSGYIKELIRQIRRKNANSVIIDFKTAEGRLSYTSLNEYAISARCALYDNNTVRQALSLFRDEGIKVIAGIYCFADETVASACPELAVKYMDSDVNWTSAKTEDGGKERLNPVSKAARGYITDVIAEVLSFSPDGILLYEASFPSGEFISSATYPGEKKGTDRNEILRSFILQIKKLFEYPGILLWRKKRNSISIPTGGSLFLLSLCCLLSEPPGRSTA